MADKRTYSRDVRGRFQRIDMDAAFADDSKFGTVAKDGIDVGNVSGAPSPATIEHPRHGPDADLLAQGWATRLEPRHPVLVEADEAAATLYGSQGGRLRDAARLQGVSGPIGHALGLEPPAPPSTGVQRRDGSNRARLPSMYQRPGVDQGDRNVNAADAKGVNQRRNG